MNEQNQKMRTAVTLGLVVRENSILLGMKKRGFGKGYWNGFGGKLHPGENFREGMKRELHEETSLILHDAEKCAFLEFYFEDGTELEGHVFLIENFSGEAVETDEMSPHWYLRSEIPYDHMWEDDQYWLPLVLDKKKIAAKFYFSTDHRLQNQRIEILPDEIFYRKYIKNYV